MADMKAALANAGLVAPITETPARVDGLSMRWAVIPALLDQGATVRLLAPGGAKVVALAFEVNGGRVIEAQLEGEENFRSFAARDKARFVVGKGKVRKRTKFIVHA